MKKLFPTLALILVLSGPLAAMQKNDDGTPKLMFPAPTPKKPSKNPYNNRHARSLQNIQDVNDISQTFTNINTKISDALNFFCGYFFQDQTQNNNNNSTPPLPKDKKD